MQALDEIQKLSDPASFYRRYYPRVYGFVSAATGAPHADVEDLVQETLLRIWKDRDQFRGESSALTWILGIAKNRAREYVRAQKSRRKAGTVFASLQKVETDEIPEDILRDAEMGRCLRQALRDLDESYSELLTERYLHGKSVRQIAKRRGESEKAIESRLHRARESLRDRLLEGEDHE